MQNFFNKTQENQWGSNKHKETNEHWETKTHRTRTQTQAYLMPRVVNQENSKPVSMIIQGIRQTTEVVLHGESGSPPVAQGGTVHGSHDCSFMLSETKTEGFEVSGFLATQGGTFFVLLNKKRMEKRGC